MLYDPTFIGATGGGGELWRPPLSVQKGGDAPILPEGGGRRFGPDMEGHKLSNKSLNLPRMVLKMLQTLVPFTHQCSILKYHLPQNGQVSPQKILAKQKKTF